MISILIPIFNRDVRKLVAELVRQCQTLNIQYQVLCFDDASQDKFKKINRELESVFGVSYLEFPKNLGRAKMRNKLGYHAMYDHMVFLDCDSKVATKKFIKNYIDQINTHPHACIYGGTQYAKKKPRATSKILHWTYGLKREVLTLEKRKKSPYEGFRSNNFMIERSLFLQHPFDEKIEGYGHEDTLFARGLKKAGIPILHIYNAVAHGGLERNDVFLAKTRESLKNLLVLNNRGVNLPTRLTRMYNTLQQWGVLPLTMGCVKRWEGRIEQQLKGRRPSMYLLDLWKLYQYHKMKSGDVSTPTSY